MVAQQEVGNPEEIKPPDRVGEELSRRKGPRLPVGQHGRQGHSTCRLGWIALNVGQLGGIDAGVFLRRSVIRAPPDKPEKSERPGDDEGPLPTEGERDPRHE